MRRLSKKQLAYLHVLNRHGRYIVYDIRCETTTTTLLALLQNPIQQSEGGKIDTLSPPTTLDHHRLVCFNRNSIKKKLWG